MGIIIKLILFKELLKSSSRDNSIMPKRVLIRIGVCDLDVELSYHICAGAYIFDRGLRLRQGGLATSLLLLLGVLGALSQELAVLGLGLLGRLGTGALVSHASALALEGDRGDQTLDLGRDQLGLLALLLDGAADDPM